MKTKQISLASMIRAPRPISNAHHANYAAERDWARGAALSGLKVEWLGKTVIRKGEQITIRGLLSTQTRSVLTERGGYALQLTPKEVRDLFAASIAA